MARAGMVSQALRLFKADCYNSGLPYEEAGWVGNSQPIVPPKRSGKSRLQAIYFHWAQFTRFPLRFQAARAVDLRIEEEL